MRRGTLNGLVLAAVVAGVAPLQAEWPEGVFGARTLAPGVVHLEGTAAEWTRNHDGPERSRTWAVGGVTARVGLTGRLEAQLEHEGWVDERVRDRAAGVTTRERGLGDTTVRVKANWAGQDDEEGPA